MKKQQGISPKGKQVWQRVIVWKGGSAIGTIATRIFENDKGFFVRTLIGLAEIDFEEERLIVL